MQEAQRPQRGFTLTELLVVLAIAGILAMIGAPAMGGLLARTQDANAEASIAGALRHARAAAVMHNARVVVCPSLDGRRCHQGDVWQRGWIIARDANHDGQPDAGVPLIAVHAAMPTGTAVITSVGRTRIAFHPEGSAAGSNANFTICHVHERQGKSVVVANSGRVRLGAADRQHLQACLATL
jgi:type IV fimbrial biogenesis protein FimT